jgi:two-component sensor histidine kinase
LRAALEHQKLLVDEINHRVKNSLQLVASLFNLQATHTRDQALSQSLQEAIGRVTAVARIHERLYRSTDIANVDLAAYVADVCKDLAGLAPTHRIVFQAQGPLLAPTDRAVRIALLTTELVTNAAKHAYPEDSGGGAIFVGLTHRVENLITVSVRDEGRGLSDDLTTRAAEGLGMRIIKALSEQMEAKLVIHQHHPGTEFEIEIPLFPSKR